MNFIKYIFLTSFFVFIGCNNNTNEQDRISINQEDTEEIYVSIAQFENAMMELGTTTKETFAQTVHVNGSINVPPHNQAVISAFSGGYIKNTPLLVGDMVKKGERLVTLENPDFIGLQQSYSETAEQLGFLKSEYDRQKTLLEENITSQKNFLKAESEYKTAIARANSFKKSLEMLNINPQAVLEGHIVSEASIYSPIDGYVSQVMVNTGTYVSPADKIIEILNTEQLHLELKIFEKDLMQLKKGQDILFRVPEASKEIFEGKLRLVGANIDPKTRMATLYGSIDKEENNRFSVGMFIEAEVITETTEQFALPEDAVVELEGKDYVLVLKSQDNTGYTFLPIEVETKQNHKRFTSFKTPLNAEAQYLTKGGYVLLQSEDSGGHGH